VWVRSYRAGSACRKSQIYSLRVLHIALFQFARRGERPRRIHDEQHDLVEIDGPGAEYIGTAVLAGMIWVTLVGTRVDELVS